MSEAATSRMEAVSKLLADTITDEANRRLDALTSALADEITARIQAESELAAAREQVLQLRTDLAVTQAEEQRARTALGVADDRATGLSARTVQLEGEIAGLRAELTVVKAEVARATKPTAPVSVIPRALPVYDVVVTSRDELGNIKRWKLQPAAVQ